MKMYKQRILSSVLAASILCIVLVSLWPSEAEARNPKPSLCNTFGGCGLGRSMIQPSGISKDHSKGSNLKATAFVEEEDEDDATVFMDDENDSDSLASSKRKLPICRGEKPSLPCILTKSSHTV